MKVCTRFVIVLVVLLSTMPLLQVRAEGDVEPWPFVYYYSYWTGSWIIERADGSDGFALGAGLNCGRIVDADWSPSGHWLLWHCSNRDIDFTNRWIAVSADDSQRVTALDLFKDLRDDYASAQWSPTDDLVLVNTLVRPPATDQAPEWGPGLYVIDANQDAIALEVTFDTPIDRAEWSPDGRFVLAYSLESIDEATDQIAIIPVNGDPPFTHQKVKQQTQHSYYDMHFIWTPDNRLVDQLHDTGQLVFEDLSTGAREELPFTSTPLSRVWYSPDGQYGLIYAGPELWLHTVSTNTLVQIVDNAIEFSYSDDPFMDAQPSFQFPNWSPDGSRALFATQDGQVQWLHADGRITALNLPPADGSPDQLPRVQWGGDMAFILWNNMVYIYDLVTESVQATFTERDTSVYYQDEPPVQDAQVSPDGRYMAHTPGFFGYTVWDWRRDAEVHLTPNPSIADSERAWHYQAHWHPNGDVLFLSEGVDLAGPGLSRWSVASADGQLIRALSSTVSAGAPQALPDRVDTSFIPPSTDPLVPGPSLQIAGQDIHPGILSWSPDGRFLVSARTTKPWQYSGACTGGDPAHLYDVATGQLVAEFPFESCGCGTTPDTVPDDRFRDAYLLFHDDGAGLQSAQLAGYSGYPVGFAWPQADHNTTLAIATYQCGKYVLILWDFSTDTVLAEYEGVSAIAFAPDGTQVALGHADGSISLAAYPEIDQQTAFATLPTRIAHLVFSADGSRLAAASINDTYREIDGELSVWDTASGTAFFHTTPNLATDTLDITPDGTTLVIAGQETYRCVDSASKPPTMIDATSGEALGEPNISLTAVAVSPDGRFLVGTGCGLVVWDSRTLDVTNRFLGNGINVIWSPDGSKLATATRFGIYVWDMP